MISECQKLYARISDPLVGTESHDNSVALDTHNAEQTNSTNKQIQTWSHGTFFKYVTKSVTVNKYGCSEKFELSPASIATGRGEFHAFSSWQTGDT